MIIEKVDDGDILFPRCPDCGVPLYHESMELGNKQKTEKKRWDECDHEYSSTGECVNVDTILELSTSLLHVL